MGDFLKGPKIRKLDKKALEVPQIKAEGLDRAIAGGVEATSGLTPIMFSGGGLSSNLSGGRLSLTADSGRLGLVDRLAGLFNQQADETRGLRDRVRPGMSELRAARLAEIENARKSSISNLRDNLSRRRVMGSSFGEDALTRAELEFGQEKERVAAETFLQELDLTNQLITQEFDQRSKSFATSLNELNLQADVAGKLLPEVTKVMSDSAQLRSQIATIEAQVRAQLGISQGQLTGEMRRTGATLEANRRIAQAEGDAKAQEGFGKLIGTGLSLALAPATGGLSLAALGSGGFMAPKTSVFPV